MTEKIVTTGTFDGVHSGHKMLLHAMREQSVKSDLKPLVLILSPHPLSLVAPEKAPKLLSSPQDRMQAIHEVFPETDVKILDFTPELRKLTHRQFMSMLRDKFGAKMLFVGHDNRFGCDIHVAPDQYATTASDLGLTLKVCHALPGVCSSAIRKALADGNVEEASKMLTRPYSLSGSVGHGKQLGRTLGFPTANLIVDDSHRLVPAAGVYAGYASTGHHLRKAIINIGIRPTVESSSDVSSTIEAHLIDFNKDIYGSPLTLHFCHRLRDEMRFPSVASLAEHLCLDKARAQEILSSPEEFLIAK